MDNDEKPIQSFDLFRLSKSKEIVDISPNTIRKFHKEGLPLYKRGKVVFVSRSELEKFVKRKYRVVPVTNWGFT